MLLGQVIMDKNKVVRTVVNKVNTIDNTFRNFKMELLAGDENYVTEVKENGCIFHLDFSKVYWNPRLCKCTYFYDGHLLICLSKIYIHFYTSLICLH